MQKISRNRHKDPPKRIQFPEGTRLYRVMGEGPRLKMEAYTVTGSSYNWTKYRLDGDQFDRDFKTGFHRSQRLADSPKGAVAIETAILRKQVKSLESQLAATHQLLRDTEALLTPGLNEARQAVEAATNN